MFDQDQDLVAHLLNESNDFRRLYDKHDDLKKTVQEANEGNISVDEITLDNLKKQKLFLKDQMSKILEEYRHH